MLKKKSVLPVAIIAMFVFIYRPLISQTPIQVGAGSYATSPPISVFNEGGYFGKTYTELSEGWPWHIHPNKQNEAIPTNKWWTATIFDQYTGRLEPYPQRVEGTSQGICISIPTSFVMQDARGLATLADTWVKIKGDYETTQTSEPIIFADFETATFSAGWTTSLNSPYPGPVSLSDITQVPTPNGFLGSRFVNTFKGDAPQVTITSPSFTIQRNYVHLLVGGGNNPNAAYVGVFINGVRIAYETGENSGRLSWRRMNVSAYIGQTAEIRIVDNTSGGWGFIMCDNIVFSDLQAPGSSFSSNFWPQDAKAYDWSDLGFTFRLEDDNQNRMDGTVIHGVPFTYIDLNGIIPVIETSKSATAARNNLGNLITNFPVATNTLVLTIDNHHFGIHAPHGSTFNRTTQGNYNVIIPQSAPKYLVVSAIPDLSLISTYDAHARNKITKSTFNWDYQISSGKIVTTFDLETRNYETGNINQPTLMALLPHHYRNTTHPPLIANANYTTMRGVMHTVAGNEIAISYNHGGMPPFMPEPLNMTGAQQQRLNQMIAGRVANSNNSRNGNSYAKGLGEESNIMLMAKAMDHPGFEQIKNNLKNELIDWFTYTASEATDGRYFFAKYPQFGALIGFPSGYGSQAFNDVHFHYGYFIMGAARLMLVDDEFKTQYGDMVKEVAKSYVNWKRYGVNDSSKQPFLRTFDAYMGNSWAGGIGNSWDGNNQESTSEATNSWFALYLLGVALEDAEITALGTTGFMLEGIATANYWFNRHGDLPEEYPFNYVGINRPNNMAMATYFHGDPAWAMGIQFVPCNFYYNYYLGDDPAFAANDFNAMLNDRITFNAFPNADIYENIVDMGAYLGGYHLNYINSYDPKLVATMLDNLYDNEGGEWTNHVNATVNYFNSNAGISYGKPAIGYHTSLASGSVYENPETGVITYLIYNHASTEKQVIIYKDGVAIDTITVGPRQFYNSLDTNQRPISNAGNSQNVQMPVNTVQLNGSASFDPDGTIDSYNWTLVEGSNVIIVNPSSANTLVRGLVPGNFTFRLTVTDNEGRTGSSQVTVSVTADPTEENIALNKQAWASSFEGNLNVVFVNDGNKASRWGSQFTDSEWVVIDLEQPYRLNRVSLFWEAAYGSSYEIHLSDDRNFNRYQVIAVVSNGDGGNDVVGTNDAITGQYLRLFGVSRATTYGYSLFEFEAYGTTQPLTVFEKDVVIDFGFSLYPNPTSGVVTIDTNQEQYHLEVLNMQGMLMQRFDNLSRKTQIDLSGLTRGMYMVRISDGRSNIIKKLNVK